MSIIPRFAGDANPSRWIRRRILSSMVSAPSGSVNTFTLKMVLPILRVRVLLVFSIVLIPLPFKKYEAHWPSDTNIGRKWYGPKKYGVIAIWSLSTKKIAKMQGHKPTKYDKNCCQNKVYSGMIGGIPEWTRNIYRGLSGSGYRIS